jgi:hypothetical protein
VLIECSFSLSDGAFIEREQDLVKAGKKACGFSDGSLTYLKTAGASGVDEGTASADAVAGMTSKPVVVQPETLLHEEPFPYEAIARLP